MRDSSKGLGRVSHPRGEWVTVEAACAGYHLPACAPPSTCRISPVVNVASDRVQPFEEFVTLRLVHGSVDDARGNGVYANAILCVFDGECARHRVQAAHDHDLNGRRDTCDWLVNESG